jgi:hypothetical protein
VAEGVQAHVRRHRGLRQLHPGADFMNLPFRQKSFRTNYHHWIMDKTFLPKLQTKIYQPYFYSYMYKYIKCPSRLWEQDPWKFGINKKKDFSVNTCRNWFIKSTPGGRRRHRALRPAADDAVNRRPGMYL